MKLAKIDDLFDKQIDERRSRRKVGPLWPKQYQQYTGECLYEFITNFCYTIDRSLMPARIATIPAIPHIEFLCHKAIYCRKNGLTDENIKSRRVLGTWLYVGIDVWEGGFYEGGAYYCSSVDWPKTGNIVWRHAYMYNQIAQRQTSWNLEPIDLVKDVIRVRGDQSYRRVVLPNGSFYEGLTGQEPESFVQEGARRVRLEEIGKYPYPGLTYENAIQMTTPPAGLDEFGEQYVAGNVTTISTPMPGWLEDQRQTAENEEKYGHIPAWEKFVDSIRN